MDLSCINYLGIFVVINDIFSNTECVITASKTLIINNKG